MTTPTDRVRAALEWAKDIAPTAISHNIFEKALSELDGKCLVPVDTIVGLTANIQVLCNVIEDPEGGNPLAKMMILRVAKDTVEDANAMIAPYVKGE